MQHDLRELSDRLTTRLTEALAANDVSQFTVRQLREFVRKEIDGVMGAAANAPAQEAIIDQPPAPVAPIAAEPPASPPDPAASAPVVQAPPLEPAADTTQFRADSAAAEPEQPAPAVPTPTPVTPPPPGAAPVRRVQVPIGPIMLFAVVALLIFLFLREATGGGAPIGGAPQNAAAPRPNVAPAQPAAPRPAIQQPAGSTKPIDIQGMKFRDQKTFEGDTSSRPYEVSFGKVTVAGGELVVVIAAVSGFDAVYDYLRFQDSAGKESRFEAEDANLTSGDAFTPNDVPDDGHWWRQDFGAFSQGLGLVARKGDSAPPLLTKVKLADGEYSMYVGSFRGDAGNGVFKLTVMVQ